MGVSFRFAVFAHNEQDHICAALDSLYASLPPDCDARVFVLINGCTDRTSKVVEQYREQHPQVTPVEISVPDKCNAWNTYVHRYAEPCDMHFFMDGDVECGEGSLELMWQTLSSSPQAVAVAGVPLTGRNREAYMERVTRKRWLFGNLYGVRPLQIDQIRRHNVKLPLGLCGNDHVITDIMKSVSFDAADYDDNRITHHPRAGYRFRAISIFRVAHMRTYFERLVRYQLRTYQLDELWQRPISRLPRTMDAINKKILADLSEGRTRKGRRMMRRLVRRRLLRLYPSCDSAYYDELLPEAC